MSNLIVFPFTRPNMYEEWLAKEQELNSGLGINLSNLDLGGTYNGYILVGKDHPWFRKPIEEVNSLVTTHGSWSFSCAASEVDWEELPEEYLNDDHWIFGFDFLKHGDSKTYWTEERIKEFTNNISTEFLVAQIKKIRDENRECPRDGVAVPDRGE